MEPGRELDALVAEWMGWQYFNHLGKSTLFPPKQDPGFPWELGKIGECFYDSECYFDSAKGGYTQPITPHYSTSISDAWEVVEKLRHKCCCIIIDSDHHYVWDVQLRLDRHGSHTDEDWDVWVQSEESLPFAICLAALKTVEEDSSK